MLVCPRCSTRSLAVTEELELQPDVNYCDELLVQTVECSECAFAAIAVYAERRWSNFGARPFQHRGHYVDRETAEATKHLIAQCPEPRRAACKCIAHTKLGGLNGANEEEWAAAMRSQGMFDISIK